eukprot:CAMPEP_0195520780 /NCGR_PEP_ID=MMETSP0794_2-20130614/17537_1 /TAXON_ID=515487 /ORGANISM="Stephanopyxis turris, Strain CCMP 815" /LENGTH=774 /DNA_ID=CAMNT_0040650203 /DNA_START=380 /DNA_END=2704 /DNA_ORIENTATION=-
MSLHPPELSLNCTKYPERTNQSNLAPPLVPDSQTSSNLQNLLSNVDNSTHSTASTSTSHSSSNSNTNMFDNANYRGRSDTLEDLETTPLHSYTAVSNSILTNSDGNWLNPTNNSSSSGNQNVNHLIHGATTTGTSKLTLGGSVGTPLPCPSPFPTTAFSNNFCTNTTFTGIKSGNGSLSSSRESANGFLNGIMNNEKGVAHTPPGGTSFEDSHFGKRMRSGSISGRLRSASDLEDRGIIDRQQRGILKDLIITSNKDDYDLQAALDQYEEGNISRLEEMIKSGALLQRRTSDLDLLEDLDLDFLTMHEDQCGVGNNDQTTGDGFQVQAQQVDTPDITSSSKNIIQTRSKSMPIPFDNKLLSDTTTTTDYFGNGSTDTDEHDHIHPHTLPAHSEHNENDDGIGDLEFNGDFDAPSVTVMMSHDHNHDVGDDQLQNVYDVGSFTGSTLVDIEGTSSSIPISTNNSINRVTSRSMSPEDESFTMDLLSPRHRADSLHLGSLLGVESPSASSSFGQWMDIPSNDNSGSFGKPNNTPNIVISKSNGGLMQVTNNNELGGIGASLAQHSATTSSQKKPSTTAAQEREKLVLERKKQRLLKKQLKEQEKLRKRQAREKLSKEKKEKEEREKEERRQKKAEAQAAKLLKKSSSSSMDTNKGKSTRKSKSLQGPHDDNSIHTKKETPSGLGLPRSNSDPNLSQSTDDFGLLQVDRPEGWVGAYSPTSRKIRIDRFMAKRHHRVWTKTVKYDVRKNFADSRLRVKGRFVKKEDEQIMRDLMSLT